MAQPNLIRLIRDKCAGRPYDVEQYVNTMDRIMGNVHRVFARGRDLQLDSDTFMNFCWEKLEDDNVIFKLADISFENDTHLRRYVRRIFENLLREKVGELSPGFRARQKQAERVLKQCCLPSCREMCGCWKLREFREKVRGPADIDQLLQAAKPLARPNPRQLGNPDSRAPSIPTEK